MAWARVVLPDCRGPRSAAAGQPANPLLDSKKLLLIQKIAVKF